MVIRFVIFCCFGLISYSQSLIGNQIDGDQLAGHFGQNTVLSSDGQIIAVSANSYDTYGMNSGFESMSILILIPGIN